VTSPLEGIVGKPLSQPYRSGRTGDWVKIKCVESEAFMVGYEQSAASPTGFASLISGGKVVGRFDGAIDNPKADVTTAASYDLLARPQLADEIEAA